MSNLVTCWCDGLDFWVTDDCVSFYAYFTSILAEIFILWSFFPEIALPFSILLGICMANILVFSYLKGDWEGNRQELIFTIGYDLVALVVFGVGFFVTDWLTNVILFIIPIFVTLVCVVLRNFQVNVSAAMHSEFLQKIIDSFADGVLYVISQLIILMLPIQIFIGVVCLTTFSTGIKIAIILGYLLLIPFLSYIEDTFGGQNMFRLAYEVTWSMEHEREMEDFRKRFMEKPSKGFAEIDDEIKALNDSLEELKKHY